MPIPPPLPGNDGAFAHLFSPGAGAFAILSWPGGWAFDTRVFESAMDEFIGKDEAFLEQWLVRQGLDKLVDVFKGMLYFNTCKHINKSNNVNSLIKPYLKVIFDFQQNSNS